MTPTTRHDRIPTVVRYDIMHETATRLRGALVALQDQHPDRAAQYQAWRLAISDLIDAVDPDDRDAIARTTEQLRTEYSDLTGA